MCVCAIFLLVRQAVKKVILVASNFSLAMNAHTNIICLKTTLQELAVHLRYAHQVYFPQHFLNFFPLPQKQGLFLSLPFICSAD